MPGVFENILGIPSERVKHSEDFIVNMDNNKHLFVAVIKDQNDEDIIIGTALMQAIIDIADNWLMLIRVELTVFADNERAIHLYEKFGFEKEGLKRFAGIRKGKYENEYLMARINPTYTKLA